jgi:plastocyanin
MALRATPTIMICLTAGIAAGVALARPADRVTTVEVEQAAAAEPSHGSEGGATAEPIAITIEGFAFSATSNVVAGTPLAVTNLDAASHTLTARDGSFDTGTVRKGDTATLVAPTTPGTFEYFCSIHPSMQGTLVVG